MTNQARNSFILHKDSLSILDKMTNEQAGTWIKAIKVYQFTGNLPELDFGMEMAVVPFVNQFKRDDLKWKDAATSGKIGNLKRWHPELFKRFNAGEISLEDALEASVSEDPSPPIAPVPTQSPPIGEGRDPSLSVSVSVSDSVSKSVKSKGFIKPTLEEIQAYCQERKNQVDPNRFLNFYESNGWKVGKNPMKDWKAAIRTWENNSQATTPHNTYKTINKAQEKTRQTMETIFNTDLS